MNEILNLCPGYKRLTHIDELYNILEPYYHMEKSKPVLCATPWKMVHETKTNCAVLLLHGYQGYPGEMSYLGLKFYNSNYDVYCPRYPGHGVNQEDFIKTKSEDWLSVARSSVGYLKKEYESVYVVGHSMGSLIATIIAKEFDIEKVALIAPAFYIRGFSKFKLKTLMLFKKELSIPWKMDSSFWGICEREEGDDQYLGTNYWSIIILKQLCEFNKVRELAINSLIKLNSKTFCVFGSKDMSVNSEKVKKLLESSIKAPLSSLIVDGANHLIQYFNDKEKRELCNDSVVKFFND